MPIHGIILMMEVYTQVGDNMRTGILRITLIIVVLCSAAFAPHDDARPEPAFKLDPVLLVHGLGEDGSGWGRLPELLQNHGFEVFILDFNDYDWLPNAFHSKKIFEDMVVVVARALEDVVIETNASRVNIIAHSFGGTLVRAYLAGWGGVIERASEYNEDVAKVIYVATPHYGTEADDDLIDDLIDATDYGRFKTDSAIRKIWGFLSEELVNLNAWFHENGKTLNVKQVSISAKRDAIVESYSANLDAELGPKEDSHHIYLKNYSHSVVEAKRTNRPSIIDVQGPDHPLYKVAVSFFSETTKWQRISGKAPKRGGMLVFDFVRGDGFNPSKLNKRAVKLIRTKPNGSKDKQKVVQSDSGYFYAYGIKDGDYELTLPVGGKDTPFEVAIDIPGDAGKVMTFDPDTAGDDDNPDDPDDPDDPDNPDDIPAQVTGGATLRAFVKARFGTQTTIYLSPGQLLDLIKQVRDNLALTYLDIERVNDQAVRFGYTAPDDKHIDAIYYVPTGQVIDFVVDSTGGGVLVDKIHWAPTQDTPW